jgi:hypothetical protein
VTLNSNITNKVEFVEIHPIELRRKCDAEHR